MIRRLMMAGLALAALAQAGCSASGQGEQQTLVDRSTLTLQDMMTQKVSEGPQDLIRRARGVMICPRIFKGGFFFVGGEGGNCVLLSRAGNGTWSYPAFYTIGSGSFGLMMGVEDNQLLLLIMTQKGLSSVIDDQVKLGAGGNLAFAVWGGGVQGSTTAAVGADIVAFAASRGLFAGISLDGSVMSTDTKADQAYYGQPYAARQIVMQMQATNPGADPLRDLLTRYGSGNATRPIAAPQQPQGYAPAYPSYQPPSQAPGQPAYPPQGYGPGAPAYPPATTSGGYQGAPSARGPIQEQSLAPPR